MTNRLERPSQGSGNDRHDCRNAFRLRERLRVRWAETDAQGIVQRPLPHFFDVAITEYWRAVGLPSGGARRHRHRPVRGQVDRRVSGLRTTTT
jgi:hypothetical protein